MNEQIIYNRAGTYAIVVWETTNYKTVCDGCGNTINKDERIAHIKIAGNHAFFCKACLSEKKNHEV